ncbi:MAG: bifunctional acetate--CoA ligase family protein/GNAT family N-acetyltransferase, partial [Chthoniobacteraceae bacterium]
IGATETVGSVGRGVMENLRAFAGPVYPINPKRSHVLGVKAYASIAAVSEPVDLAVIVTPARTVPGIIGECAEAGVRAAVIISAGFKECGADGVALEHEILARRGGMRIVGPNCLGLMIPALGFNATFATTSARPGNVAFLSQSGALCTAILDWSLRENVGFSAFVSLGSMLDVGWGDLIDQLGDDPQTKSIVCYMESVGNARAFLSAARAVAFTKPIIVIKVGHTDQAARAAASHTGSMTGSDAVLDAAFRRAGVLRVDTIEELFDMAEVLAKQPRPRGPRLAIVTNAGGPGALATDMLVSSGGQLAALSPETLGALDALLPAEWSHGNPVDLLGAADASCYARCVEIALRDANVDGVLVVLTPQSMTDADGTAAQLAALANSSTKPVLASWMGGSSLDGARATLNAAGIPSYNYPDEAARAFALMWSYSDRLRLLYERPALRKVADGGDEKRRVVESVIAPTRKAGRTLLNEVESKQVLAAYGIPTVETAIAESADEAVRHAERLGWPVVLKLFSDTITHKTDVGGVQLDLRNAAAVRRAWRAIERSVTKKAGAEHFRGVTVQPMIARGGIELILGSSIDPQFGPVLLFGAGGELVEIMEDRALGLPPLTTTLARRLMERTRIFRALGGVRGRAPVDLDALAQLLVSFSHLVAERRWIAEIDINPLLASSERLLALDARIVLHPAETREDQLPRLAIRPYPAEYVSRISLKEGAHLTLRPIRPEDEEMLAAFHATLSDESVHLRYFGVLPLERRIAHDRLVRQCFADYDRDIALVADHAGEILGVGRLTRRHGRNDAEFALLVADAWQHRGLGSRLLAALIHIGREEKLARIVGTILPENSGMLHLCREAGFRIEDLGDGGELQAVLSL